MPNAASLNFPRFLLPAFPRWDPSLHKRHRPVEDVTEQPSTYTTAERPSSSSSSASSSPSSSSGPPARHERILSHDSGCVVSDDDEDHPDMHMQEEEGEEGEEEVSYTSASESAGSSTDSLEIYLDTESGYGGSDEDILTMDDITSHHHQNNTASSSSTLQQQQQQQQQSPKKHKRFPWSRSKREPKLTSPKPTSSLTTTTSYLHCLNCRTNLCFTSSVISKGFTGRHGRAYLVTHIIPSNIIHGRPTSRALQTGAHTVSDISCKICGSTLGWKYIHAEERSQRYKIGKYILETGRVGKVNVWDGELINPSNEPKKRTLSGANTGEGKKAMEEKEDWEPGWETLGDDEVEVDLADEEELEEMFSGNWNKDKVLRRRERKRQLDEMRRKADSNV
ncbi:Protein yippee-like 2 [Orbilia ellipsospora]|uniref:Protein yippee-like 2 n=1 Tax=Orbilia ellipsospora TaxID=2528407 RepID=A0AAV9XLM9_9PEZI